MKKNLWFVGAAVAVLLPANASAVDEVVCSQDMICASLPTTVVSALQEMGYRALLKQDANGQFISTGAGGYEYLVSFEGCKEGLKCDSLQFIVTFSASDDHSAEYANDFNLKYRYFQAAARDDKKLRLSYDVSTAGGLTKYHFKNVVERWVGGVDSFLVYAKEVKAKKAAIITSAPK